MGHLLFGLAGSLHVLTTIIDGRVVMRDHRVLGVEEEAAYREARGAAERLWKRIK
jgi:cytosine/adenosine deaminase-related metal-dependent hydrolase